MRSTQSSVTADDGPGSFSSPVYLPTDRRAIGIGSAAAEITRFELNPSEDRSNSAMVAGPFLRTFADALLQVLHDVVVCSSQALHTSCCSRLRMSATVGGGRFGAHELQNIWQQMFAEVQSI